MPDAPERAGWVLASLIAVATVANLGLAVANVALPDIGEHFDASQTDLNLVAIAYSLGLACSVLYFGAVGDRYGRKGILLVGMALTIPADLAAAFAPSIGVLFAARIVGGLAAGMAYPTTLALITALWAGARSASLRHPAPALLVGVPVPAHPAVRLSRPVHGGQVHPRRRQRDHGAG